MVKIEDHLGGHSNVTCIDPPVLEYLKQVYKVKSMIDIGCGPGGMQDVASQNGIEWVGVDGDPNMKMESLHIHDYTKGEFTLDRDFDLAWSVEFLEHVEEKYIPNYMKTFQLSNMCVVTAAPPGTPGYHHVNCKDLKYWVKVFDEYGFDYDKDASTYLKMISAMRKNFFKKSGMVFTKRAK